MPSPILARADALIQRHRPRSGTTEGVPVLTDFDEQRLHAESREPVEAPDETTDSGAERPIAPAVTLTTTTQPINFDPLMTEPEVDDDIPVLMDAEPAGLDLPPPLFPPTPKTAAPNGLFAQLHAALDRETPDVTAVVSETQGPQNNKATAATASSAAKLDHERLDESHLHELCQRIEARLAVVLPRLIEEVLDDYLQERQIRHHD